MELALFILILIHLSVSSLLRINSSHLQLPSQDTTITPGGVDIGGHFVYKPWPRLPYLCYVKNGILINFTSYGDTLSKSQTPRVLQALVPIRHQIQEAGGPDDMIEAITIVGAVKGNVYTEIGFYSLHALGGIKRSQAIDVLNRVWALTVDFFPAKEITSSSIILDGGELALFRLSFAER